MYIILMMEMHTSIVKICTVSDIGTLQYSNESEPIVWSDIRLFTKDAHKVISRCSEMLTSMLSANSIIINEVTTSSLTEGIIIFQKKLVQRSVLLHHQMR